MHKSTYENLKTQTGSWQKVNFHTHAGICVKGDCGELPLDDVVEAYRKAKYQGLAISNHNTYISPPKKYDGIELLQAVEYSKHPHMLQIGVTNYEDVSHQEAIFNTVSQGGFVILCHPNWKDQHYWETETMETLEGYTGIEILNPVIYTLKGSGLALDKWDHLLSKGKKVFGFGNDDFHQWRDIERSFNVIYAKSATYEDIKEAVLKGCFYVSSGVALKQYAFENETLFVEAGFFVESYINVFTYRFVGENGRTLYETTAQNATFKVPQNETYVRVEVTAEHGAKMYLQPLFLE